MRSPFPGMDPYIEAYHVWEDFHDSLLAEIKRVLSRTLPPRYAARLGERTYVVLEPRAQEVQTHGAQPDVAIVLTREQTVPPSGSRATAVLDAVTTEPSPIEMEALVENEYRESFIEITSLEPDRKLVTTIEVLSPSNKRPGTPGWNQYNRKRQAHFTGQANLVEIDLLRGGQRPPMFDDWPADPYYILVFRKGRGLRCTVWPAHFVRPLPPIPVPLLPPDSDVSLAIQALVEQVYEDSRYANEIDYRKPCRPQISPAESEWLEKRLREMRA